MRRTALMMMALGAACPALAQTNVAAAHKHSWSESTGWMNWRDADGGAHGVRVLSTHLRGWIWSENIGWISVGQGPLNGTAYTNVGTDHGVNVLMNGDLMGYAWGENIGWINFGTPMLMGDRARADFGAGRLRGFAWGENIGWVNLDDDEHYVAFEGGAACYPNCDQSAVAPVLNVADFGCFLNKFAAADPYANCDGSTQAPALNVADFGCFLNKFAAGCP